MHSLSVEGSTVFSPSPPSRPSCSPTSSSNRLQCAVNRMRERFVPEKHLRISGAQVPLIPVIRSSADTMTFGEGLCDISEVNFGDTMRKVRRCCLNRQHLVPCKQEVRNRNTVMLWNFAFVLALNDVEDSFLVEMITSLLLELKVCYLTSHTYYRHNITIKPWFYSVSWFYVQWRGIEEL